MEELDYTSPVLAVVRAISSAFDDFVRQNGASLELAGVVI